MNWKRAITYSVVILGAIVAMAAFVPAPVDNPVLLFDSSGNPYPSGAGTALTYTPPPVTCYTNESGAILPCTFAGGGGSGSFTTLTYTVSLNGINVGEEVVAPSATPTFSNSYASSIITLTANVTSWTLPSGLYGSEQKTITWCEGAGGFTVAGSPANVRGAFNPFPSTTAGTCSTQAYKWSDSVSDWFAVSPGSVNQ